MGRVLQDYPDVSLEPEVWEGNFDFEKIFGRTGPLHVEIGSGKGTFLVEQGRREPEANFLGIEYAGKYYRYAVDRVGRWGLDNVRVVRAEAVEFLRERVPLESVDVFHVYFPDPWPKRRHHKRRFFQPENVKLLISRLKKGGTIRVATDHEEYFGQIRSVVLDYDDIVTESRFWCCVFARGEELVGTNFERKYIRQGRRIHSLAVRKR